MPRFKSIIFYHYSPKIKFKKMQNFQAPRAPPCWGHRQTPVPPAAGGFAPRPPIAFGSLGFCPQAQPPQLRNFGYAPATLSTVYNYMGFRSFCFEQFFLHRSVANLMMLTIDVCLMLNCFLFEKFYLHYALCDFDSILLHCTKLFIRLRIDREQILDVIFENPLIEKSCVRHCFAVS